MTTIERLMSAARRSTSITRQNADPYGIRVVSGDSVPLRVIALPFGAIGATVNGADLAMPGAYIITGRDAGGEAAYVGESGNVAARLPDHADKRWFAAEAFVLAHVDGRICKPDAIHWQMALSQLIEEAGVARLVKGTGPCRAPITPERANELDLMLAQALPLLVDAGCRCVIRGPRTAAEEAKTGPVAEVTASPAGNEEGEEEDGPIEIGVSTTPIGTQEDELAYGDLWARGYDYQGRYLVAAGSEMRKDANPSANARTIERRKRLVEAGAAVLTGPVGTERYRLQTAVAFPSKAIAAKVLSGAHLGTEKWRRLPAAAPLIIAP